DPLGLVGTGGIAPPGINTVICDGDGHIVTQVAPLDPINQQCLGDCILQHELSHLQDFMQANPNICIGKPRGTIVGFSNNVEQKAGEIKASEVEIACLRAKLSSLACTSCDAIIEARIAQMERYRDSFK